MTISRTATQLVNNPPPMLAQVFADHRAQYGARDLEREVEHQVVAVAMGDRDTRELEAALARAEDEYHGQCERADSAEDRADEAEQQLVRIKRIMGV